MASVSWEYWNAHLHLHSYLGCPLGATLYDYECCAQICQQEIDAIRFPHLLRWHLHISYLIKRFGKFDYRGRPLSDGAAPKSKRKRNHFCVLDFEKTCEEDVQLQPQEIIEFFSVLIVAGVEAPLGEFEKYVRPTTHRTLTSFCTKLTGITQQQVDAASSLPQVLYEHHTWLRSYVPAADECVFVTCGDMDLKRSLPEDPNVPDEVPACYLRWVNIKKAFGAFYSPWKEKMLRQPRNMVAMLEHLNIVLEGQHHSGIDDCRNIAKVLQRMFAEGWNMDSDTTALSESTPARDVAKKDAKKKAIASSVAVSLSAHIEEVVNAGIEACWRELQTEAPKPTIGKPTPEQIASLKAHKQKVKAFLTDVGDKVARQLQGKHEKDCLQRHLLPSPELNVSLDARTKELLIVARSDPVSVWDGTPPNTFNAVLPFYSHTARSKDFERVDSLLGIDRRVFSNLYVEPDGKLYRVPEAPATMGGAQLMRHAFLAEVASTSTEAFFQAAKCELEADARFIMELSSHDAAKYGQGRLTPNDQQLQRLEELGLKTELNLPCPNPAYKGQDAKAGQARRTVQRRSDWEEVKMDVMMHVCRCKFGVGFSLGVPTTASASLTTLADSPPNFLLVEHPRVDGDRSWGDGGDGKGSNMLGKCLSQIVLEARGAPPACRLPSFDQVRALNDTIVDYKS